MKSKSTTRLFIYVTAIIAFFVLYIAFVLKKPFLLGNDQWFQYNNFYEEWARLIDNFINNGELPFYSWNSYLGSDFYSSMGYYCIGNIFLPLLYLLRDHIQLYTIIETVLCFYISAFLMRLFLGKYKIHNQSVKILISIIYAFGGMASIYIGNYMFLRLYAFVPLMFYGVLKYFDDNKRYIFIIAVAILFLQNYYLMWPVSIFLFVFCLVEEFNRKASVKKILIDFIKLIIAYMAGLMISGVVVFPSVMFLLGNSRIGDTGEMTLFWPLSSYFSILFNFISVNLSGFINSTATAVFDEGHAYAYNLTIGILPFISALSFVTKKENRNELVALLALCIVIVFKPLCSLFHGLSEPSLRWMLIFNFYILVLAAKGLDSERDLKKEKIVFAVYSITLLLSATYLLLTKEISITAHQMDLLFKLISYLVALVTIVVFSKKQTIQYVLTVLTVVLSLSLLTYYETKDSHNSEERINTDVVQYLCDIDEDLLFRLYVPYTIYDPGIYLQMNESLHYEFMSTSSYNSMIETSITRFNHLNGIDDWIVNITDENSLNALGVKYLIVPPGYEFEGNLELEYLFDMDYFKVYKNNSYRGFGYTMNQIKYTDDFESLNDFDEYILIDDSSVDLSDYSQLGYSKFNISEKGSNYLKGNIETTSKNILYLSIPNNEGWKIYVNGELVTPISVNGGFIGLELQAGHSDIEMYFIPKYLKPGIIISAAGVMLLAAVVWRDKKSFLSK